MKNESEKIDYLNRDFEPGSPAEALEMVGALRQDLEFYKFSTIDEGGREVLYPNSAEGLEYKTKIDQLIEQYGGEQIFIDYLAEVEANKKFQEKYEREKAIKKQEELINKLEEKLKKAKAYLKELEEQ